MSLIDFHILTFKLVGSASTQFSVIFTVYPGVVEKDHTTILHASNVQAVLARGATACAIQLYRLEMNYNGDFTPKSIQVFDLLAEQIMFKADGTFERLSMTADISNSRVIEVIGWLK